MPLAGVEGPLVATVPGYQKAGAFLTELGAAILARYRAMQREVDQVSKAQPADLVAQSLLPAARPAQHRSSLEASDPSAAP